MTAQIWILSISIGIFVGGFSVWLFVHMQRQQEPEEIIEPKVVGLISKETLRFRLARLFDGATVAIEPAEALDIFDEVVERTKKSPSAKLVLRFEIWPAATPQWLVSALTSSNSDHHARRSSRDYEI